MSLTRDTVAPRRRPSRFLHKWRDSPALLEPHLVIAVIACFAFGLAARFWIFSGPLGEVNADEAVVGLMALHLIDGEWSTFYWGQSYGGTLEVILLAPVVAVLGATRTALQVVPFLESVAATALVWSVALRVVGRSGAITAAALFWSFPAAFVWWQTRQMLFYLPVVILGLIVILCTLRIEEDANHKLDWFVLGLATGIGWWTSPQIVYFVFPAALWLLIKLPISAARSGWLTIPAFLLGASPWIGANFDEAWLSLTSLPHVSDGPGERLQALVVGGVPMALGLKVPFVETWLWPYIGPGLYVVALCALTVALTVRRPPRAIHIGLLLAFPILFTLIPATAYVGSGRYFFFLAPAVAIALASLPKGTRGLITIMAVAVALTAVGLYQMRDLPISFVPPVDSLLEVLDQHDLDHVVAGYWLAYKLDWETDEEIIAYSVGVNRYPPYADDMRQARTVAYVYNRQTPSEMASAETLRTILGQRQQQFDEYPVDGYTVIVPDEVVLPDQVPVSAVPNP